MLPSNYSVAWLGYLYMGTMLYGGEREKVNKEWQSLHGYAMGTHCYTVTLDAAKILLKRALPMTMQVSLAGE